jgi:hypothetical protein
MTTAPRRGRNRRAPRNRDQAIIPITQRQEQHEAVQSMAPIMQIQEGNNVTDAPLESENRSLENGR